jgi:hypothetical protein
LRLGKCWIKPKAQLINPKEKICKSNRTMKKGKKTSTLIVLAVEILTIVVLHAMKISQSEKMTSARESSKNASTSENQPDSRSGPVFSFAEYK